jgi:integrase
MSVPVTVAEYIRLTQVTETEPEFFMLELLTQGFRLQEVLDLEYRDLYRLCGQVILVKPKPIKDNAIIRPVVTETEIEPMNVDVRVFPWNSIQAVIKWLQELSQAMIDRKITPHDLRKGGLMSKMNENTPQWVYDYLLGHPNRSKLELIQKLATKTETE